MTRRQRRRTLRAGSGVGAVLAGLLASFGLWFAVPAYIAVVLGIRLFAWPTICGAFRPRTAGDETCRALVNGKLTGCDRHRLDKARDLSAVLDPRHPASPLPTMLRLVRGRRMPNPAPALTSAPRNVTFRNALSIYGIIVCVVITAVGVAVYILARSL